MDVMSSSELPPLLTAVCVITKLCLHLGQLKYYVLLFHLNFFSTVYVAMEIALRRTSFNSLPSGVIELIGAAPKVSTSYALFSHVGQQRRHLTIDQLDSKRDGQYHLSNCGVVLMWYADRERVVVLGSGMLSSQLQKFPLTEQL
jgi:hypothetical protein